MTDTFFDLQRFAVTKAVLVGGQSSFSWEDGTTFGAGASTAVGTSSNPAYLDAKGGFPTAGTSTAVYLSGEKNYSFSLDGKADWDLKLGSDGVAQVTSSNGTLALGDLDDAAAVLNVNGTFEETVSGNSAYIKTATDTKVTLNTRSNGLVEQFGKDVSDIDVVLYDNALGKSATAEFAKGASNIDIGVSKDDLAQGFGFEKAVTVGANYLNEIVISSDKNNTVTVAGGDVWKVKKGKSTPTIFYSTVNKAVDVVNDIKGATLESADGVTSPVAVAGVIWNSITGGVSSIAFDSVGAATIDNTAAITVQGQDGAKAIVKNLTSATMNGIKVTAAEEGTVGFGLETLESGGISTIDVSKALGKEITVAKDAAFLVTAGKSLYGVATTDDVVTFNATASEIQVNVKKEKMYETAAGNAEFVFASDAKNATINGANISLGSADGVVASSDNDHQGITAIAGLDVGKAVSVANDSDGFIATFDSVDGADAVTFEVNGAKVTAAGIDGQIVSIAVDGTGKDVTVTGMNSTDSVTVEGGDGVTYHFKDETTENKVAPSSGESLYVTLNGSGAVADAMDAESYKKLKENDKGKWDNVATIGNQDTDAPPVDTVAANLSDVFAQFYNLGTSEAGQSTMAGFVNEDSTTFETSSVAGGVNFSGRNGGALANEAHVSLSAGSNVGKAPVNIQKNESNAAVDVVVDLRAETVPATVAIGTNEDNLGLDVTASHKIYLSNAGGFAYLGERATGQNQVFAGATGAQIRHDGSTRATLNGGAGVDTIWAGKNDIVTGGAGADQYYDSANYTINDYDFAQGDALIATRLNTVDFTRNDVVSSGNTVSFGTSRNAFTIGKDQNAPLFLNVAIMDTEANLVGNRTVVLAGANGGTTNASSITGGALIIADGARNGKSGDAIVGTAGNDDIYVSANDIVDGGSGNDYITISGVSAAENDGGAKVVLGVGKDTVAGWTFGFDTNAGATELLVDGDYRGLFENDRLMVSTASGSVLFDDTAATSNHGQADVLINGKKYMAIRTTDSNNNNSASYGIVKSNDELADAYVAEREGTLIIDSGVTKDLGIVQMGGVSYQNITSLVLANNNKALVLGSDARETVVLGGDASVGASKEVFLGDGNDVIIATSDDSVRAGNELFFGADDGRDSIMGFNHYLGLEVDPDRKYADTLHIEKYGGIYTGTDESGRSRIEFVTEGDNRVFLYEDNGINVNNIYQIQVGAFATKAAKIGNSNAANVFALDTNVDYYVGSSAENAQDTLTVSNIYDNVNVWLDGSNGTDHTSADEHYFRGITVIDATAETNTNVSLAGAGGNDTLYAGGEGTYNYLWGGSGDNVLYGSENSKQDYFFYVRSAGAYLQTVDDTVTGGHDEIYNYDFENNDVIWLGDTTLDDIKSTDIGDTSVTIEFKNGGSLTVNSLDDVRVRLNEGAECYIADRDSKTWSHE